MEAICRNCEYFKARDAVMGNNTWGLCPRFGDSGQSEKGNNSVFRWWDDFCPDFQPRKQSAEVHKSAK
jgi:hypothetical protein